MSCSPSARSPRKARETRRPSLRLREGEREEECECLSRKKRSGKIVRSHFDEACVCARARSIVSDGHFDRRMFCTRVKRNRRVARRTADVACCVRMVARLASARRDQARLHRGSLHPGRRAVVTYTSHDSQSESLADASAGQSRAHRSRAAAIHPATAYKRSSRRIAIHPAASIYCRRRPCAILGKSRDLTHTYLLP